MRTKFIFHKVHSNRRSKSLRFFNSGSISLMVLILGMAITATIGGLVLFATVQYTASTRAETFEKALSIAQSGAEYYRWHLAHDPLDFTDGTATSGPYVHEISDPYGNTEGMFSLDITPPSSGSSFITITSTGWLNSYPEIKRTVVTKYGKPSVAKYAFLNNANVWYGQKITVHGKIFSNGGIRMDGTHDSTIQSAKQTYTCGSETGCDPATTKPGIWGEGGPQELWEYPATAVDFNSFALDFSTMKTAAQTNGLYLAPSGAFGYHLIFNADGTVTVKKVNNAQNRKGWSVELGCENLYQKISNESNVGTYSLASKPIIFAEDHLWVDGVVNGKVTVAAAKFPLDINKMNIWINSSIVYQNKDGSSNLGLIAQNDIYFALEIPQVFEINGALLAQKGKVIRHNYKYQGCSHQNDAVRQQLIIYGSVISNLKSYWSFGQGGAGFGQGPTSGFSQRDITYDPGLFFTPPPYFPSENEFEFISWEEK